MPSWSFERPLSFWFVSMVISFICFIITTSILLRESQKRKNPENVIPSKYLSVFSYLCIAVSPFYTMIGAVSYFPGLCLIASFSRGPSLYLQIVAMECYQLSRLYYCFSRDQVHSEKGYPKWIFGALFSVLMIWVLSRWERLEQHVSAQSVSQLSVTLLSGRSPARDTPVSLTSYFPVSRWITPCSRRNVELKVMEQQCSREFSCFHHLIGTGYIGDGWCPTVYTVFSKLPQSLCTGTKSIHCDETTQIKSRKIAEFVIVSSRFYIACWFWPIFMWQSTEWWSSRNTLQHTLQQWDGLDSIRFGFGLIPSTRYPSATPCSWCRIITHRNIWCFCSLSNDINVFCVSAVLGLWWESSIGCWWRMWRKGRWERWCLHQHWGIIYRQRTGTTRREWNWVSPPRRWLKNIQCANQSNRSRQCMKCNVSVCVESQSEILIKYDNSIIVRCWH